jgi:hypothetical protein
MSKVRYAAHYGLNPDIARLLTCADFVAEVGDDKSVAAGANFLS